MTTRALIALGVALAGASCTEPDASGPPELNLGRDVCAECGMSIVEAEFAASAVVGVSGSRTHAAFDDVGCLLVWRAERQREGTPFECWVMAFESRTWIPFEQAHYVVGTDRRTPMHSQIVSFRTEEAAQADARTHGGSITAADALTIPPDMAQEE